MAGVKARIVGGLPSTEPSQVHRWWSHSGVTGRTIPPQTRGLARASPLSALIDLLTNGGAYVNAPHE